MKISIMQCLDTHLVVTRGGDSTGMYCVEGFCYTPTMFLTGPPYKDLYISIMPRLRSQSITLFCVFLVVGLWFVVYIYITFSFFITRYHDLET